MVDISLKMQQLENQYLTKVAQVGLRPRAALEEQMEQYKKVGQDLGQPAFWNG